MVPLASTIAIDGPAGAGKTTIGKRVAGQLGYSFLDTGVMYRTVALLAHRYQVDPQNETSLVRLITEHRLDTLPPVQSSSPIRLLLDGEDVTSQLRTIEVDSLVSHVSKWPAVRQKLVQKQRELALQGKFVLAGRDIGTIVLPDADLKIFLTASLEERVARRLAERRHRDPTATAEAVRAELLARDTLDSNRETSPLQIAADAHILDTTHMSIEEAVAQVLSWAKRENN